LWLGVELVFRSAASKRDEQQRQSRERNAKPRIDQISVHHQFPICGFLEGFLPTITVSIEPKIGVVFLFVATLARAWKTDRLVTVATTVIPRPMPS
jgi:hypothetical protein